MGLAFLGAYFIFDELLIKRGFKKVTQRKLSSIQIAGHFLIRIISVGSLIGLIGYGIGNSLINLYPPAEAYSVARVLSVDKLIDIWFGFVGLVSGFCLALIQYIRIVE